MHYFRIGISIYVLKPFLALTTGRQQCDPSSGCRVIIPRLGCPDPALFRTGSYRAPGGAVQSTCPWKTAGDGWDCGKNIQQFDKTGWFKI